VSPDTEPRPQFVREPPRRTVDKHIRELVIGAISLLVGVLATFTALSREMGTTQANLTSATEAIRAASVTQNNLLLTVQAQAVQLATLAAQVSALLGQRK